MRGSEPTRTASESLTAGTPASATVALITALWVPGAGDDVKGGH
jgi:hypothetical protein